LIYVFDIASDCPEKDFQHFEGVLTAIEENSPDARIFVLVHKMDLVAKEEQEMILEDRRRLIEERCSANNVHNFQCFGTSIWDETLYKAWSEIVTNLIPNIGVLESHLDDFCRICDADEVVLFERATFLVISHSHGKKLTNEDVNNVEDDDTNQEDHLLDIDHDASTATTVPPPLTLTESPSQTTSDNINNMDTNTNVIGTTTIDGHTPNTALTPNSNNNNENAGGILITNAASNTPQQHQNQPPLLPHHLDNDDITSAASSLNLEGAMPSSIDGGFNDSMIVPSVFSEVTGVTDSMMQHPYHTNQGNTTTATNTTTTGGGGGGTASSLGNANRSSIISNRSPSSSHTGGNRTKTTHTAHNNNNNLNNLNQHSNNQNRTTKNTNNKNQTQPHKRKKKQKRQQQQVVLDTHRFEKISNIVKQFKLSCEKAQSQFQGMEVSNSRFTACIDEFTASTYIMVIVSRNSSGGGVMSGNSGGGGGMGMGAVGATTLLNVKNARSHFERFIPMS